MIPGAPPFQFIAIAGARQVYDPAPAVGGGGHILLEGGDDILLESGDFLLLE